MKRGYLWVDWVELGCRGWDIDESGAERAALGDGEHDYAHLDRTTLDLIMGGSRKFVADAVNDLVAAGLMRHNCQHNLEQFGTPFNVSWGETLTASTSLDVLHSVDLNTAWRVQHSTTYQHPSGASVTVTPAVPQKSKLAQWWHTLLGEYVTRWLQFMEHVTKLRKAA